MGSWIAIVFTHVLVLWLMGSGMEQVRNYQHIYGIWIFEQVIHSDQFKLLVLKIRVLYLVGWFYSVIPLNLYFLCSFGCCLDFVVHVVQRFSTCGPWTTRGPRPSAWWSASKA